MSVCRSFALTPAAVHVGRAVPRASPADRPPAHVSTKARCQMVLLSSLAVCAVTGETLVTHHQSRAFLRLFLWVLCRRTCHEFYVGAILVQTHWLRVQAHRRHEHQLGAYLLPLEHTLLPAVLIALLREAGLPCCSWGRPSCSTGAHAVVATWRAGPPAGPAGALVQGVCQGQRNRAAQDPEEARQEAGQQRGAAVPQGRHPSVLFTRQALLYSFCYLWKEWQPSRQAPCHSLHARAACQSAAAQLRLSAACCSVPLAETQTDVVSPSPLASACSLLCSLLSRVVTGSVWAHSLLPALEVVTVIVWPPSRGLLVSPQWAQWNRLLSRSGIQHPFVVHTPAGPLQGSLSSCRHLHRHAPMGSVPPFPAGLDLWRHTINPLPVFCPAASAPGWPLSFCLCAVAEPGLPLLQGAGQALCQDIVVSCTVSLLAAVLLHHVLAVTGKAAPCRSAGRSASPATAPSCTPPCWMSSRLWRRSWTRSRGRQGVTNTSPPTPSLPPAAAPHQRRCERTGEVAAPSRHLGYPQSAPLQGLDVSLRCRLLGATVSCCPADEWAEGCPSCTAL